MTPQEVADLRRAVRRLVEAASGEALEDARVLLEGHVMDEPDPFVRRECSPLILNPEAVGDPAQTPVVRVPPVLADMIRANGEMSRAERERRLDDLTAMTQDMGGYPELDRPPTLAEPAAARPRVTIPGRYCGDGHGVRIGRLVEDRDGMAQVQVDGFGVLNVPSREVER